MPWTSKVFFTFQLVFWCSKKTWPPWLLRSTVFFTRITTLTPQLWKVGIPSFTEKKTYTGIVSINTKTYQNHQNCRILCADQSTTNDFHKQLWEIKTCSKHPSQLTVEKGHLPSDLNYHWPKSSTIFLMFFLNTFLEMQDFKISP